MQCPRLSSRSIPSLGLHPIATQYEDARQLARARLVAKELASLDWLSGGRLVFGMGVGCLEPEMAAVGVPMEGRGARADEYLAAMRALWEQEAPAHQGRYVQFEDVD